MIVREVTTGNIVARQNSLAAELVNKACYYKSEIHFELSGKHINAKSIMGMFLFNPEKGETVLVSANGADEEAAIEAISTYLSGK